MIDVQVKGLAELGEALEKLEEKIATKILRDAGIKAMQVVKEDMQRHANFDKSSRASGDHMRDAIYVRKSRGRKKGGPRSVTIRVGPTKQHTHKAFAQEYGTIYRVPRAFMRPALDYNRARILRVLTESIRDGVEKNQK